MDGPSILLIAVFVFLQISNVVICKMILRVTEHLARIEKKLDQSRGSQPH